MKVIVETAATNALRIRHDDPPERTPVAEPVDPRLRPRIRAGSSGSTAGRGRRRSAWNRPGTMRPWSDADPAERWTPSRSVGTNVTAAGISSVASDEPEAPSRRSGKGCGPARSRRASRTAACRRSAAPTTTSELTRLRSIGTAGSSNNSRDVAPLQRCREELPVRRGDVGVGRQRHCAPADRTGSGTAGRQHQDDSTAASTRPARLRVRAGGAEAGFDGPTGRRASSFLVLGGRSREGGPAPG